MLTLNKDVPEGRIPMGTVLRDPRPKLGQGDASGNYPSIYVATTLAGS